MSLNLFSAFFRTNGYLAAGRLRFPRGRVGETIRMPDGRDYRFFRQVILAPNASQPETPGAIFVPGFHVSGMSPRLNELFSLLPIPFFVGLPGFRTKLWLVHEPTGDFAGLYEWDNIRDAENYGRSFAADFMLRRSRPGSVSFSVYPRDHWDGPSTGSLIR